MADNLPGLGAPLGGSDDRLWHGMTFKAMRADLVRRGLITDAGKLTPAGDAYCVSLLADLRQREARADRYASRRWDMRWPHERS